MNKSLVNIKIEIQSAYDSTNEVNRKLRAYLLQQAYAITHNNNSWIATTYNGEGEEIKQQLRKQGFCDKDFRIHVEYQRKWGFL